MTTLVNLLADCEDRGVGVRLSPDGRILLTGEVDRLPAPNREALRARKPELAAYLTESARPSPEWVMFVARNLDVVELLAALVTSQLGVWIGERLHYRATPAVVAWLTAAVDRLCERSIDDSASQAADLVADLQRWAGRHYPPHLIVSANRSGGSLPDVPPPIAD